MDKHILKTGRMNTNYVLSIHIWFTTLYVHQRNGAHLNVALCSYHGGQRNHAASVWSVNPQEKVLLKLFRNFTPGPRTFSGACLLYFLWLSCICLFIYLFTACNSTCVFPQLEEVEISGTRCLEKKTVLVSLYWCTFVFCKDTSFCLSYNKNTCIKLLLIYWSPKHNRRLRQKKLKQTNK